MSRGIRGTRDRNATILAEQHHMLPDISKIRVALGYRPRYTPEQTMERAVAWMRDQGLI